MVKIFCCTPKQADWLWGAHNLYIQWVTGAYFTGEKEAGLELTTNFDQVPRLRISGAVTAFSHTPLWHAQAHIYTYLHH